jgi:hypothetical protein
VGDFLKGSGRGRGCHVEKAMMENDFQVFSLPVGKRIGVGFGWMGCTEPGVQ